MILKCNRGSYLRRNRWHIQRLPGSFQALAWLGPKEGHSQAVDQESELKLQARQGDEPVLVAHQKLHVVPALS